MKKLILSALLALLAVAGFSQLSNRAFIGGNIGGDFSNRNNDFDQQSDNPYQGTRHYKSSSVRVFPGSGYFLSENFAIGLSAGYTFYKYISEDNSYSQNIHYSNNTKQKSNYYSIMPFVRYNKFIGNKVSLFGQFEVGMSLGKGEDEYQSFTDGTPSQFNRIDKATYQSFFAGFRPGIVFFVTEKIGVEATFGNLSYVYTKSITNADNYKNEETSNSFVANFRLSSFSLGMQYYFDKRNRKGVKSE